MAGKELKIVQKTGFPFEEEIDFTITLSEEAAFPFHLRIPGWTKDPAVKINGEVWNLENAPIELSMRGIKIPEWKLINSTPHFPAFWGNYPGKPPEIEEITLVPYGCTTLRITAFPVNSL